MKGRCWPGQAFAAEAAPTHYREAGMIFQTGNSLWERLSKLSCLVAVYKGAQKCRGRELIQIALRNVIQVQFFRNNDVELAIPAMPKRKR